MAQLTTAPAPITAAVTDNSDGSAGQQLLAFPAAKNGPGDGQNRNDDEGQTLSR